MVTQTIEPHGGKLVQRTAGADASANLSGLPSISLGRHAAADLQMIAIGALSPLEGFMGSDDYRSVLVGRRLASGLPWTLPVTLPAVMTDTEGLSQGREATLLDEKGTPVGMLDVSEIFRRDRVEEAELVYGTTDPAHPGVARLLLESETLVAGRVTMFQSDVEPDFTQLTPAETRSEFEKRGWRTVVGFQTRNPIHRAHEHILKCALEVCDGLMIHPLVGETKVGDISAAIRWSCYEKLLGTYFPHERVLLSAFPAWMRYGGPREAIFHAIVRKNYGCTHFIVGRDHAGVGNFYDPMAAQRIFDDFTPAEIGITPLFFEHAFYCRRCGETASAKTCPHSEQDRVTLTGTKVRSMLGRGDRPPPEITRPEIANILIEGIARERTSEHGSNI